MDGHCYVPFQFFHLSSELQINVLSKLDLGSLYDLAHTNKHINTLLRSYPTSILEGLLDELPTQLSTLIIACFVIEHNEEAAFSSLGSLLEESRSTEKIKEVLLGSLDVLSTLDNIYAAWSEVEEISRLFAQAAYNGMCLYHEPFTKVPPLVLSETELHRIISCFYTIKLTDIAFNRAKIYTLFGTQLDPKLHIDLPIWQLMEMASTTRFLQVGGMPQDQFNPRGEVFDHQERLLKTKFIKHHSLCSASMMCIIQSYAERESYDTTSTTVSYPSKLPNYTHSHCDISSWNLGFEIFTYARHTIDRFFPLPQFLAYGLFFWDPHRLDHWDLADPWVLLSHCVCRAFWLSAARGWRRKSTRWMGYTAFKSGVEWTREQYEWMRGRYADWEKADMEDYVKVMLNEGCESSV